MSALAELLKSLAALAKAVLVLLVLGIVGWAVLASCFDHPSHTSAPPFTPPPGAQHSSIADVYVPPGAQLEPDTGPGAERWDMNVSYADAVAQEEALLPVGRYLGDYPWCKKAPLPLGSADNTSWIWGNPYNRPPEVVIVSVFQEEAGPPRPLSVIVIRHGAANDCG